MTGAAGTPTLTDQAITSRKIALIVQTTDVATSETTTSASYVNLTTTSSVTITSGVAQVHELTLKAWTSNSSAGEASYSSIAIAGAAAVDIDAGAMVGVDRSTNYSSILATAQVSGAVHTAKHKVSAGTGTFLQRRQTGKAI